MCREVLLFLHALRPHFAGTGVILGGSSSGSRRNEENEKEEEEAGTQQEQEQQQQQQQQWQMEGSVGSPAGGECGVLTSVCGSWLPFVLVDERYSTVEALAPMYELTRRSKRGGVRSIN